MKHPPIPPNLEWFFANENGVWRALMALPGCDYYFELEGEFSRIGPNRRKMIAAVARCGWTDEAERIETAKLDDENFKLPRDEFIALANDHDKRFLVARDNAEAWQKWGQAT